MNDIALALLLLTDHQFDQLISLFEGIIGAVFFLCVLWLMSRD